MNSRLLRPPLALLALGLSAPLLAQPAPPPAAPPAPAPSAAPGGPGGMMMRDPFGDATVSRKDAEASAAARFAALDTDKDGFLSPAELAAARPARPGGEGRRLRGNGPRGGGMMRMDANGDGKVSRDEFITGTLRRFDMMDANHDGQLTKAERQAAFEAIRARMEERMRERFQGGGDGGMGAGMGEGMGGGMGGGGD